MYFVLLPPEINSGRMYSGPGSGPLLAAAGSWESLAAELEIAATTTTSVLSDLTSLHWRGPAAESMVAAAAPYVRWLATVAEQTKQTAMQARAAAAAYEQAHAMTVPPIAVAANRTRLATLIATNFFGQNTPAIAATEAQYAEYWAQDAAAMYGYAINGAMATRLPQLSSPHQTTKPDGRAAQNAAVTKAVSDAVTTNAPPQPISATPSTAVTLPSNPLVPDDFSVLDALLTFPPTIGEMADVESIPQDIIGVANNLGLLSGLGMAAAPTEVIPALSAASQLISATSSVGASLGSGNLTVTLSRAVSIGSMSVPASWTTSPTSLTSVVPDAGVCALTGTGEPGASGSSVPGIPGMRPPSRATLVVPRYGVRITVMTRPLSGG
ncbi:PPE family protein [Mycobacterium sp. Aquia_216]|uniref:PPE family protein n=1 Tax=Mycobacterium sp. Aquia_216 TaxID=2991729 RepID=UPI00227B7592|nr:PPE family protein [Mycobacterium sp. Aquia_216]WAJ42830.1 PPE family protein [Mycobacterium sp. Aquia_216]